MSRIYSNNKINPFKYKYMHQDSMYQLLHRSASKQRRLDSIPNTERGRSEMLKMYQGTKDTLQTLPATDAAFAYFFEEERAFRKMCLAMHMLDQETSEKQLCFLIETRGDLAPFIEICDTYKFQYTWLRPYLLHGGDDNQVQGIVINLRKHDIDSAEFLEAYEFILEEINNKRKKNQHRQASLELAECFF